MKLAADLHIHSCLSPCADMLMTPNNIAGMARLKGLDVIAVSDHNSAKNLPAIQKAADICGLLLLPAIEAETREEVHVLCYLPTVDAALALGDALYARLPDVPNMPAFFGEQAVMDENDEIIATEPKLLIQSTDFSIEELASLCRAHGGAPVPAHVNRTSNSVVNNLGFIPAGPRFTALEVYRALPAPENAELWRYHVLYSSDAHELGAIFERDSFIDVRERSVEAILDYLRTPKVIDN
ncbi:MAG TPA: PHP domain-containing protein [Clostridia bacterium]|nr:PHP domain-containing protein [Clostridia bacterium]